VAAGNWANRLEGPNGVELVSAAADTAIDASVRSSFTAFSGLISEWTGLVRHWRCGLSEADRARLALPAAWKQFYNHTPVDGTLEQKSRVRRQKFLRAIDWAEQQRLIGVEPARSMRKFPARAGMNRCLDWRRRGTGGFPPRAGMNRQTASPTTPPPCVPRARGDEPRVGASPVAFRLDTRPKTH
jgi:hypothetical protein